MNHRKSDRRFRVLDLAMSASQACVHISRHISRPFGDVVSQLTRAALSVPLNISEGAGRTGRARKNHYSIAYGSAQEASTAIEILLNMALIDENAAEHALDLLDQVRAILWTLMNGSRQ